MFFWSSSELASSVDDLSGRPSDSRLAAAELLADDGVVVEDDDVGSLSLVLFRLPYLLFKYLAHELSAAPSFSVPLAPFSGELSRDFNVCDDRLRARSWLDDVAEP